MPARHRLVYKVLEDEMAMQNGVHALSLKTRTPQEWEKSKQIAVSILGNVRLHPVMFTVLIFHLVKKVFFVHFDSLIN